MDFFDSLDGPQKAAVTADNKDILVCAPPGSGKTRVLAARFARLVKDGISPEEIIAVTFTNRAARELKDRIRLFTDIKTPLNIGTFHSLCLKFLKKERPGFSLIGRAGQIKILEDIGIKKAAKELEAISYFKNTGFNAPLHYERYCQSLEAAGFLDLDDLVLEAARFLENGLASKYGKKIKHILVDEYQDINPLQARLIKTLSPYSSVFAIGDPDQAIYSFRGSTLECFLDFEKDFPGSIAIGLGKNYRSGSKIVEASRKVISNNKAGFERGFCANILGGELTHACCADERAAADFIVKEIETLMGGFSSSTVTESEMGFGDFAVLFRTRRESEALMDAFSRSSLPYHYRNDDPSGLISEALKDRKQENLSEFLNGPVIPGIEKEALETVFAAARALLEERPQATIADLIEELSLIEPSQEFDIQADRVSLLTMHSAKGLEFRVVFVTGLVDGNVPLISQSLNTDIEEERRLFYVAMTRAKERLYLISPREMRLFGQAFSGEDSRFLKEVPEALLKKNRIEKKSYRKKPVQKSFFD